MSLRLEALQVFLGPRPLVTLDVTVTAGSVLTLMGASGSGKSTALAAIIGTIAPEFTLTGRILLEDRDLTDLPTQARQLGLMFQDSILFPHLTVGQNLGFGLAPGFSRTARRAIVEAALAEVGLAGFADRDPATLSGGQSARVALMRTLLAAPKALLLDEPFSRLDAGLRGQMRDLVFGMARARGLPVILVTHDAEDAKAAGGPVMTPMGKVLHL
jgi:putative thiamine transport system ATP-binding protein